MVGPAVVGLGVEALSKLALEIFHEHGKDFFESLDFDLRLKGQIEADTRRYIQGFVTRHGNIKILNMVEPVSLEAIYTDSNLWLGFQGSSLLESPQELYEKYKHSDQNLLSFGKSGFDRHPALELLKEKSRVVILGGPGAGKSTLLKKVGIEALKTTVKSKRSKSILPVFIELKNTQTKPILDIFKSIVHAFVSYGLKSDMTKVVKSWLEKGRLLLLFDGLDEVPQETRFKITDAIQNFAYQFSSNIFLVSSRPAAYQKRLENFSDLEIASFDEKQINQAIMNWFPQEPNIAIELCQKINLPANKSVKKLMCTPLLLALTCVSYKQKRHIFPNKSDLYDQAISLFLSDWRVDRHIDLNEDLDSHQKEIILTTLAHKSFSSESIFMYEDWAEKIVREKLLDMDIEPGMKARGVVRNLDLETGLLIRQAREIYSFSHETIQEFLTAKYITSSFSLIQSCVDKYLLDERWQDVFVFLSGFRQSKDVINLIEQKSLLYLENKFIQKLLLWINSITVPGDREINLQLKKLQGIYVFLCFSLYHARTQDKRERIHKAIDFLQKVCFPSFVEQDRNKSILCFQEIISLQRLIAALMAAKHKANLCNYQTSSFSGKELEIRNVTKQIVVVANQSKKTFRLLEKRRIFKMTSLRMIDKKSNISYEAFLGGDKKIEDCFRFCEEFIGLWEELFSLNIDHISDFNSVSFGKLKDYLYCVSTLKKCSDLGKRFSKEHWAGIQSKMLAIDSSQTFQGYLN